MGSPYTWPTHLIMNGTKFFSWITFLHYILFDYRFGYLVEEDPYFSKGNNLGACFHVFDLVLISVVSKINLVAHDNYSVLIGGH
jgi:hypothetical protein